VELGSTRVLILFAPVGGGHQSVARALGQALHRLAGPRVEVRLLDLYSAECSRFPLTGMPGFYRLSIVRLPRLWQVLYSWTDTRWSSAVTERLGQPFVGAGLRRQLAAYQPDVVVRVLPMAGRWLTRALVDANTDAPVVTVVTDLVTVHASWVSGSAEAYLVPTPEAAAACAAAGIPAEQIRCLGLPVPEQFRPPEQQRAEIRRELGLEAELPTVLLMGGGEGSGQIEAAARALSAARSDAQLVILSGRNDRLRRRLATCRPAAASAVLGYVDDVAPWMRAADLLITKAGPSTVMEALHSGLPMVLMGSLPQEAGTAGYLLAHGAAVPASDARDAAAIAAELLSRPDRLHELCNNGAVLRRPNAALEAATLILETAGSAPPAAVAAGQASF
jgi:1,2-diacylglycerol 3-beta-galactosyltransferase